MRSGAPWRDLPEAFGPYITCYNGFVRWRRAGVWSRIIDALAAAHDPAVQMIDTSIVRVHQHGACITRNLRQSMGRSRGGLTSKIHALVDSKGLPVRLALTPGEAHDNRLAGKLLSRIKFGSMLLGEVVGRKLVVARRDPTTLLDPIEEPFDPVAWAVEIKAETDRIVTIAFRWDVGPCASLQGRAPAPAASEAGKGRQRQGARHVSYRLHIRLTWQCKGKLNLLRIDGHL